MQRKRTALHQTVKESHQHVMPVGSYPTTNPSMRYILQNLHSRQKTDIEAKRREKLAYRQMSGTSASATPIKSIPQVLYNVAQR